MAFHNIGMIGRAYRHVNRYRHILTILFKYGFGDLVETLRIDQYLNIGLNKLHLQQREKVESFSREARIRMVLEELGPTFIKMGQILSTRPDLLPVKLLQELEKLQENVPPFPFSEVKNIVEEELKQPLEELFQHFDENVLAAASIGQVHRARLIDGDEVVVKVQRPNIRKTIAVDLEIMLHLASLMEKHLDGWEVHQPTRIVKEFARTLEKEMDYGIERLQMERFAKQMNGDPTVYIPRVYPALSAIRVLTMEAMDGVKSSDIDQLESEGFDCREIATRGANLMMKQIFTYGFFHADPHPGNILILPHNVVCYLDFGMMGHINRMDRENFADLVTGVVQKDESKVVDALLRLTYSEVEADHHSLERDVTEFIDQTFFRPLKELEFGKILQNLLEMLSDHRLRLQPNLFMMLKALSTVEGLGRTLDPDFDITEHAKPFVRRIQIDRFRPQRIVEDMTYSGSQLFYLMKDIPGELRDILSQFKKGKTKIEFEKQNLDKMLFTLDQISNRIVFGIVLASLIIGSSLIVHSKIPPIWHKLPIIGLIGFLVSGIMGFWLLLSIIRHGRM